MIRGFNQPLPLWRDLFSDKVKMEALAHHLQGYKADDKVLRFPAGTGGKTFVFERDFTQRFANFCLLAGVNKVSMVVNQDDISGFFSAYEILSSNMEVTLIEFDNENYLRSHIQKSVSNFKEFWLLAFNYNKLLDLKAKEYANNFIAFRKKIEQRRIKAPLAFVSDIPNDAKSSIWLNNLKDYSDDAVIHVYGQPNTPNYHAGLKNSIDKMKDLNVWITETNGIHFGDNMDNSQNQNLAFSPLHFSFDALNNEVFESSPNVKGVWHHMLFDILKEDRDMNYYRKLSIYPDGFIKDEYGA